MVAPRQIREFSQRLAETFRPRRIVLFGSYATGTARADSDVDLLVVLPYRGSGLMKAAQMIRELRPRFSVDLIVKTPAELQRRLAAHDSFLSTAVEQGQTLYEAADS